MRLVIAAALLAVLVYSYYAFASSPAAVPTAFPAIVNTNGTTVNGQLTKVIR